MFGIGGFELFIILIFGFLIFGPDKLPEIAKTVGKGIARFRQAQQDMNETLGNEKFIDLNNPDEPFKNPVEVLDRVAKRQEEKKAKKDAEGGEEKPAAEKSEKAEKPADQSAGETPATKAKADGEAAKAADAPAQVEAEPAPESFTERKARYERERAMRQALESTEEPDEPAEPAKSANVAAPKGATAETPTAESAKGGE